MSELKVPKNITQAELDKALQRLEREKVYRAKMQNDPARKAAQQKASKMRRIKDSLLLQKAKAAGVTVSDKEVDAYYTKMYGVTQG